MCRLPFSMDVSVGQLTTIRYIKSRPEATGMYILRKIMFISWTENITNRFKDMSFDVNSSSHTVSPQYYKEEEMNFIVHVNLLRKDGT